MPVPLLPTLAAGLDWLEGLIPLAVFVFWVLAQVVSFLVRLAGGGEPAAPPPRPAGPRPPALPAPRADAGEREAIARQLEEFLGRSGRGGAAGVRPPRPRPRPPAPVPPAPPRTAAGAHELRRLDTGDVARHVHEVFDHGVGQLAPAAAARDERSVPPQPVPTGGIAEVLALVRSPAGIRQVLIARELLERPEHRW